MPFSDGLISFLMAKDSFWFKHDANASRDIKLREIHAIYGMAGLGMYWCTIEVLREQNNYVWKDDERSIQILATMIGCDVPKYNGFVTDCKRIQLLKTDGGNLYSDRLINDMSAWETKKTNRTGTKRERNSNGIGTKHITESPQGRGEERREEERRANPRQDLNSVFVYFQKEIGGRLSSDQIRSTAAKFHGHIKDWHNWESAADSWILKERPKSYSDEPSQLKKSTEV